MQNKWKFKHRDIPMKHKVTSEKIITMGNVISHCASNNNNRVSYFAVLMKMDIFLPQHEMLHVAPAQNNFIKDHH